MVKGRGLSPPPSSARALWIALITASLAQLPRLSPYLDAERQAFLGSKQAKAGLVSVAHISSLGRGQTYSCVAADSTMQGVSGWTKAVVRGRRRLRALAPIAGQARKTKCLVARRTSLRSFLYWDSRHAGDDCHNRGMCFGWLEAVHHLHQILWG